MLCENATSGISVSLGYVLSKLECVVSLPCHCLHVEYRHYASRSANRIEPPGTSNLEDPHLLVVEGLRLGLMPTINRMRSVCTPPTLTYTHPLAVIFPGQPYGRHCDSEYDATHDPQWYRH